MITKQEQYRNVLSKYLPEAYIETIVNLLCSHPVRFKITKPRKTKLGDYRGNPNGIPQITINNDLNPYSFLITTIHEFAHLVAFEKHGRGIKAHGKEWQHIYSQMMMPVIEQGDLPKDVESALLNSLVKVKASSCTDQNLHRVLMSYDAIQGDKKTLEELEANAVFELNGKRFTKGHLRRTRFLCVENSSRRQYLISAMAQVKEL